MEILNRLLRRGVSKKGDNLSNVLGKSDFFEKHKQGTEQLGELFREHTDLKPSLVIDRLENIHERFGIPNLPLSRDWSDLWFYQITKAVAASPDLTPQDVQKMTKMYAWNEVDIQGVGGVNFSILEAAERFPQLEIYEDLKNHFKKVKDEIDQGDRGTHRFADLSHEYNRLQKLLPRCSATETPELPTTIQEAISSLESYKANMGLALSSRESAEINEKLEELLKAQSLLGQHNVGSPS